MRPMRDVIIFQSFGCLIAADRSLSISTFDHACGFVGCEEEEEDDEEEEEEEENDKEPFLPVNTDHFVRQESAVLVVNTRATAFQSF